MLAHRLKQPTRMANPKTDLGCPMPFLFGFAPGGVCRAADVATRAVGSYSTLSPLLSPKRKRSALCCTFPGVAPAGRYPAPCLRGARTFLCLSAAAARPTDTEDVRGYRKK